MCHILATDLMIYIDLWQRVQFAKSATPKKIVEEIKRASVRTYSTFEIKWTWNRKYLWVFSMEISDFFVELCVHNVLLSPSCFFFFLFSFAATSVVRVFFMIPLWLHSIHIWPGAPNIYTTHIRAWNTSLLCIIISPWVLLFIKALPRKLSFLWRVWKV